MSKLKVFALAFLLTTGISLTYIYVGYRNRVAANTPKLVRVADSLFVTSQLKPNAILNLHERGITTVVDIRPDGEAADQAPSATLLRESMLNGIDFHYIPVPHECIPDDAVTTLSNVLAHRTGPTVLYCHSGRRAVRTFALTEASRPGGPGADAILKTVQTAGFSADDLKDDIARRIAQRANPKMSKSDGHEPPQS